MWSVLLYIIKLFLGDYIEIEKYEKWQIVAIIFAIIFSIIFAILILIIKVRLIYNLIKQTNGFFKKIKKSMSGGKRKRSNSGSLSDDNINESDEDKNKYNSKQSIRYPFFKKLAKNSRNNNKNLNESERNKILNIIMNKNIDKSDLQKIFKLLQRS